MTVDTDHFIRASQSLNRLSKALKTERRLIESEKYLLTAAEIELSSADLQRCWGGPFNGQDGRIAILSDLLAEIQPDCFVETGCFRGISTGWLAEHYKGPIYTCEIEQMYAIQAMHNTRSHDNVTVVVDDSRSFLANTLSGMPNTDSIMFYLDAHWEHDLPLAEELDIIYDKKPNSVVIIDDFMVPDDPSYGWDDYGEGKSLDARILTGHIPGDATVFFPSLKGEHESGARRGCCVIASSSQSQRIASPKLRGASLENWLVRMDSAQAHPSREREGSDGGPNMSYPNMIRSLNDEIDRLNTYIEVIERDRAQRLTDVIKLTAEINQLRGT